MGLNRPKIAVFWQKIFTKIDPQPIDRQRISIYIEVIKMKLAIRFDASAAIDEVLKGGI